MRLPDHAKIYMMTGAVVILAGIVLSLIWSEKPLDLSKEEAPFSLIHMPPQGVYGTGYMDGGSVGILIIDHSGARHELTFPIDYNGIRNAHPNVFSGNMNDPKKIYLKNPERAKKTVIRLIDEYGKEWDDPRIDSNDLTARARRALASPPDAVAFRAFEKLSRTFGF